MNTSWMVDTLKMKMNILRDDKVCCISTCPEKLISIANFFGGDMKGCSPFISGMGMCPYPPAESAKILGLILARSPIP